MSPDKEAAARRGPAPSGDPGLARERTALAWTRTGLALAGASALAIRAGIDLHAPAAWFVPAGLPAAAAVVAAIEGGGGYRRGGPILERVRALRLISLATAITGIVALALAIVG